MAKRPGFTLLEIMTVIGVAAVLLAIGLPSMQAMKQNAAVNGATQELVSVLRQAQGRAIAGYGNSNQQVTGGASTYTYGTVTYALPSGVTVATFNVTFLRKNGTTSTGADIPPINVTGSSITKHIAISATGIVTLQ